jgi:transposase
MKIQYLWTPERDYWLKNNAKDCTLKQLSGYLRIGKEVVKTRLKHLGLECKPSPRPGRPKTKIEIPKERIPEITWTSQEDQVLIHGVENLKYSYRQISRYLLPNCSTWQCEKRYIRLLKRKKQKITLTIEQIQEMDFLLESQKEMAISLFRSKPLYAHNYISLLIEKAKQQ